MWGNRVQRRRNLLNLPAEGTGKLAIWVALQSDLWQSKLNLKSACFTRTLDEEQRQAVPHAPRAKGPASPSRQRGCQCFFDKRVKQKYPAAHERETKHIIWCQCLHSSNEAAELISRPCNCLFNHKQSVIYEVSRTFMASNIQLKIQLNGGAGCYDLYRRQPPGGEQFHVRGALLSSIFINSQRS